MDEPQKGDLDPTPPGRNAAGEPNSPAAPSPAPASAPSTGPVPSASSTPPPSFVGTPQRSVYPPTPPPPPPPPLSGSPRATGPAWSTPQSTGKGGSRWFIAVALVFGVIGLGATALWWITDRIDLSGGSGHSRSSRHHDGLKEIVMEETDSRNKIVVIDVGGVISGEPFDYQGNNLVSYIDEQLDRAAEDRAVKAVLLKVDSPGGEVLASDEIYKLIADFQEDHDKPVIASMGTVAASGGYYVSAPCRWIVAHDLTITGSIGVIMQSYNWRGLMDKLGVRPQVFKSGQMKDMLSPDKELSDVSPEEHRIVQDLVNETFDRFKSVIEEGRGLARARNADNKGDAPDQGRVLAPNWKEFADGRLLSGKEAWRLGLVDELGDFSAARARAEKLAGIEDATLVQYLRPASFSSLFRMFGKAENARIQVDLGVKLPQFRAGIYFLAPQLVR